ncbi:hypothetical protein ASE70_03930 [Sphingomonas sp. Leaf22]|nr:hypothetical protein ASE70_03930 [Sphingomonas sp. Leaf22]
MAVTTFGLFKVEELSARADKQEAVREAVKAMSGVSNERMQELANIGGDSERLFVPLDAWATYVALRAVIVFAFARLNMIAIGIKDSHKLIDGTYIINILKAAMPAYNDYLDRYGVSVVGKLVDPLEELLLKQLRSALNGDDADQQAVEQSAKVLRLVREFQAEAAATLPEN